MMRSCLALLLSAAACLAQSVETIPFRAVLLPGNEVPPVNVNASGAATVWLHVVRNAQGQITSASTDFDVNFRLPEDARITGMHIHRGRAGENGPVTIDSGIRAAEPVVPEGGMGRIMRQAFSDASTAAALETVNGMLSDASNFYVNVHTTANPGGVIRGQLQRAHMVVLLAPMNPANEVPPVTNSGANGTSSVIALATRDNNGMWTSGHVIFDVNYRGLADDATLTGYHIHEGPAGVNGPVTINSGLTSRPGGASGRLHFDVEVPMNNISAVRTLAGLFENPAGFYVNLHTSSNPAGLIRGQLRNTDEIRFPVTMLPANEVPAITGSNATAPASFTLHTIRGASGDPAAAVAIFNVNHRLDGAATITGLHVHNGRIGENGPVSIDSGLSARMPVESATGNGNIYRIALVDDGNALAAVNSAVARPSNHYLNLHTTSNPGGLVRAQLAAPSQARPVINAIISAVSDPSLRTVAPGGLMTIFGSNLAAVVSNVGLSFDGKMLPNSFNGTTVRIGGMQAPVVSVGEGYIVAQVPFEIPAGSRQVTVETPVATSDPVEIAVRQVAPAIFFDTQGGVFTDLNFQLVGRMGMPARRGQPVIAFATGLGAVTAPAGAGALMTGQITPPAIYAPQNVTVTVDGRPARVIGSAASPGFAGLYQTVFVIPDETRSGAVPVQIRSGETVSNTVTILVQ